MIKRQKRRASDVASDAKARERIKKQKELIRELRKMAIIDPLTELYNRRFLMKVIDQHIQNFHKTNQPCCLVMVDIDHFKRINDEYGHDLGDAVLVQLAALFRSMSRPSDYITRYGGEEFVILLPDRTRAAAKWCERVRKKVAEHVFVRGSMKVSITLSFGVAPLRKDDSSHLLLKRADKALYSAKHGGRNCVAIASVQGTKTRKAV